jgi:hypothetical protein
LVRDTPKVGTHVDHATERDILSTLKNSHRLGVQSSVPKHLNKLKQMAQILHNISKRKQHKLIGAPMPLSFFSYIALFTIARGITKTDVIRTELLDWEQEMRTQNPETKLVTEILKRIRQRYVREKAINRNTSPVEFIRKVTEDLEAKGLSENQIQKIINRLENGKDKIK